MLHLATTEKAKLAGFAHIAASGYGQLPTPIVRPPNVEAVAASDATVSNQRLLRLAGGGEVPYVRPSRTPLLQRKCACGGSAGISGECAECRAAGNAGGSSGQRQHRLSERADATVTAAKEPSLQQLLTYRCPGHPNEDNPQTRPFTQQERHLVNAALWSARSMAGRAYQKLGQRDPLHLRVADRAFHAPVTFDVLDDRVSRIKAKLDALHIDGNLFLGTCDDFICSENSNAYTRKDLANVVICPFFFLLQPTTQVITLIHEAGHMAAIDVNWTPGKEAYCRADEAVDCGDICTIAGANLLENVDAWARFIYCLALSP